MALGSRARSASKQLACLAAACAIVLTASFVADADDEVIDRVVAVVAGDVIMLSDLRAARDLGLVEVEGPADTDRAILSALIDRALILDEVDRYTPPEPAADAIDRAFGAVRARFASSGSFAVALARVGLDERRVRDIIRQSLRIRAYLNQRFAADTPERTQAIVNEWVAGLRRRAEIVDLSGIAP